MRLIFFLLISAAALSAESVRVCLNMIVKNEKDVIERALESVLPFIDTWVIVDTGSTDGTQEIIQNFMEKNKVPGKLYERPWVDFAHNRNEALQLGKKEGEYLLFIDADEYLRFDKGFSKPRLDKDYYHIVFDHGNTAYQKIFLIRTAHAWKWVGVLHEVLIPAPWMSHATVEGVKTVYTTEGARSKDPKKYLKDMQVLEKALEKEPGNSRYWFYYAQSCRDARKYEKARIAYQKRIDMGGWGEEVFYSYLQVARIAEWLEKPKEGVCRAYLQAYMYRPSRAEPLYFLANYLNRNQDFERAFQFAQIASAIPEADDILFQEPWINRYGALFEQSLAAYWTGRYLQAEEITQKLLKEENLPENYKRLLYANKQFIEQKLAEQTCQDAL